LYCGLSAVQAAQAERTSSNADAVIRYSAYLARIESSFGLCGEYKPRPTLVQFKATSLSWATPAIRILESDGCTDRSHQRVGFWANDATLTESCVDQHTGISAAASGVFLYFK
jgi:hypothetical protein